MILRRVGPHGGSKTRPHFASVISSKAVDTATIQITAFIAAFHESLFQLPGSGVGAEVSSLTSVYNRFIVPLKQQSGLITHPCGSTSYDHSYTLADCRE